MKAWLGTVKQNPATVIKQSDSKAQHHHLADRARTENMASPSPAPIPTLRIIEKALRQRLQELEGIEALQKGVFHVQSNNREKPNLQAKVRYLQRSQEKVRTAKTEAAIVVNNDTQENILILVMPGSFHEATDVESLVLELTQTGWAQVQLAGDVSREKCLVGDGKWIQGFKDPAVLKMILSSSPSPSHMDIWRLCNREALKGQQEAEVIKTTPFPTAADTHLMQEFAICLREACERDPGMPEFVSRVIVPAFQAKEKEVIECLPPMLRAAVKEAMAVADSRARVGDEEKDLRAPETKKAK